MNDLNDLDQVLAESGFTVKASNEIAKSVVKSVQKKVIKEKEIASKEAMQEAEKALAKQAQHTSGAKKEPIIFRKSLKK